ncbi:MAG TPA: nicotinate-nucleotide adenylyltransferase [Methanomicrobiales archaeon]|nr:nicotinate-nucleotide adenylyltransferase [Methanomicrobiales archaeon]
MKKRIGIFGGTFDPIHLGHIRAAEEVRAAFGLDKVLFIPSYIPPHKQSGPSASAADRYRMVELACRGKDGLVPSPIEVEAKETSYSILTLNRVRGQFPEAWTFFVLGVDAFLEIGTWREYERALAECLFIVTGRPGHALAAATEVLGGVLRERIHLGAEGEFADESLFSRFGIFLLPIKALEISSTDIRNRLRQGASLAGLVPNSVEKYIRRHQLYSDR